MDTQEIGPDGKPALFEGGSWFSQDHRYRWDGVSWTPTSRPGMAPWLVQAGVGVLFVALFGYVVYTLFTQTSPYTIGFFVGVVLFFVALFVLWRTAERLGPFAIVVRGASLVLALIKILTLFTYRPPT